MTTLDLIQCLREEAKGCEDSSFSNGEYNSTFIILAKVFESLANRLEAKMKKGEEKPRHVSLETATRLAHEINPDGNP